MHPQSVIDTWEQIRKDSRSPNPGLILDKFSISARQEEQKSALAEIEQAATPAGAEQLLARLWSRREMLLGALGAVNFEASTVGPFTLHLSRASALENAGIALHPVYGFCYLPGSGLKGLARAYAETVWLPAEEERSRASDESGARSPTDTILDVFGRAPSPTNPGKEGAVIFHDAWPRRWPRLQSDILNSHHAKYYSTPEDGTIPPPGDWEAPVLVYFLVVPPKTVFQFALSRARPDVPPELLELAKTWLMGGLSLLGAGAKTSAGYGRFEIQGQAEAPSTLPAAHPRLATHTAALSLVTPAFLAGPYQNASDCTLRGPTLRGMLRWWWRTLYFDPARGLM